MDKIAQLKAQLQCTNCAQKEEEDEALLKQIEELKIKQKEIIEKCNRKKNRHFFFFQKIWSSLFNRFECTKATMSKT